jgi:hypothetical protein
MKQKYCKSLLEIFIMVVFSCFFGTSVYCQDFPYQRFVIISALPQQNNFCLGCTIPGLAWLVIMIIYIRM